MLSPKTKQAKAALERQEPPKKKLKDSDFLSSGLTLLNLATYGRTFGGVAKGHIYRFCGRSSSGKTFICRTILAEAVNNSAFDEYELVYDDVERGALMDTEKFFGKRLVKRLVPPERSKDGLEVYSETINSFYKSLDKRLSKDKKFIWICDSLDSLRPDKVSKMTDNKAKTNSQSLRELIEPLQQTGSILILVSQTRADMQSIYGGEIASGGRAPEFYSTWEVWMRVIRKIKAEHNDVKYKIGSVVQATVKKNRLSGSDQDIEFLFYPSYGIDDIGSNIDFLTKSGHWKKGQGGYIEAEELGFRGLRKDLIAHVEAEEAQREVQVITGKAWRSIQDAITPERRPRYQ